MGLMRVLLSLLACWRWCDGLPWRGSLPLLLAAALLASALRPQPALAGGLPAPVVEALRGAGIPEDAVALMVAPPGRWGPQLLHQADRPMQPGSTMKLVTSVVALDRLGSNHRGFTELLASVPIDGPVLRGDLVLRGGADPELGLAQLYALLAELRWRGVEEIAGDIVLDRSLFRPARPELGVPPFDEAPEFAYNVIPDALTVTGGTTGLELASGSDGLLSARLWPPLPGVDLQWSDLRSNERDCRDWDAEWLTPEVVAGSQSGRLAIRLRGAFPKACQRRAELALLERNAQIQRQLALVWTDLGGRWTGNVRDGVAPPEATPVARRVSRPWGELLRQQNKQSDNVLTRLSYLSLGLRGMAADSTTPTAQLAEREVRRWFAEQKIDARGLVLDNGSGLSRSERLTPRQLVRLLQVAQAGRQASELMMSLPVAGTDGTLRNRLKQGPATGWARLKTGTLRNVQSLAGYVPDARQRLWVVAMIVNHEQAAAARPALDALVDWVAGGGMRAAHGAPPQGHGP